MFPKPLPQGHPVTYHSSSWRFCSDGALLTFHRPEQVSWSFFLNNFICFFISCFVGSLLLHGLFSGCREWGLLSSCSVRASYCRGFSCCRAWALGHAGFNSYGAGALLLHGRWDLTGSGVEPVSPALAGRFFITEPPGKPSWSLLTLSVVRPAPIGESQDLWSVPKLH